MQALRKEQPPARTSIRNTNNQKQVESMNAKKKSEMKRWLLPMLMCMFLFMAGGCGDDFETFEGYETLKLSEWNDKWNIYFEDDWELYSEYKNQHGWVKKDLMGNLGIVLNKDNEFANLSPKNISQNLLEEDMEIIFSGEVRVPFANIYPLPLILKNIQVKKQTVIK